MNAAIAGTEFYELIIRMRPSTSIAFFFSLPARTTMMNMVAAIKNGKYISTRSSALEMKTHLPSLSFSGSGHEPLH
jgi:hypothetical protein